MEIIFEIIIQLVFEVLFNVGISKSNIPFEQKHPVIKFFYSLGSGIILGILSIAIKPYSYFKDANSKIIALTLITIASGALMAGIGKIKTKKELRVTFLEHFIYGATLAFFYCVVRYFYTNHHS